jgi:hypothetical protein
VVSAVAVKRSTVRGILIVALILSAGFAAWSWFRPYAWNSDPAARSRVVGCLVKRDRANFWMDVHARVSEGETHDLMKPVRLVTATGREIQPAETTLGGDDEGGTTDLWFKFWLEPGEIDGPLTLRLNDGALVIKSSSGEPDLGPSGAEYFVTHRW